MTKANTFVSVAIVGSALSAVTAHAFPIAAVGTEGLEVIASGGPVTAVYEGNSAGYDNYLYLELNSVGEPGLDGDQSNDLFVFFNHGDPVGATKDLGSFLSGTELVFRLFVSGTGEDFYSGDASRSLDGLPHARVEAGWAPDTTLVSFEDLYGLPEGDSGFNDLSFSFTSTTSSGVPDGSATFGLLGLSVAGLVGMARRIRVFHRCKVAGLVPSVGEVGPAVLSGPHARWNVQSGALGQTRSTDINLRASEARSQWQ